MSTVFYNSITNEFYGRVEGVTTIFDSLIRNKVVPISLTADVSGILPIANGGSGISTTLTPGSVLFAGVSGIYSQDNASFFYDNTNDALGIFQIVMRGPEISRSVANSYIRVSGGDGGGGSGASFILYGQSHASFANQMYINASAGITFTGSTITFTGLSSFPLGVSGQFDIYETGSAQLQVRGWEEVSGAQNGSGQILIGIHTAFQGRIHYEWATGTLYLDNSYNTASAAIKFRTRTSGSAIDALVLSSLLANFSAPVSTPVLSLPATGGATTSGQLTLVLGVATVNTTAATSTCLIFFQRKTAGGTIGFATTYTVVANTSFTVTSDSALDTSTYNWWIVETH